jgi:dTDP-4-dehydrorhamnose reductase
MTKISVLGYAGRLGSEIAIQGADPLICDITKIDELNEAIYRAKPDIIINCAALTDVDNIESKEGYYKALEVNCWGIEKLLQAFDGRIIHISTDYVFDGKRGPYGETYARYSPINWYGYTKTGGEALFLTGATKGSTLIRTTGLYGNRIGLPDFVSTIMERLGKGEEVLVTNELRHNQSYIPHIAEAILKLCELSNPPKVLNLGSREILSRYSFALLVATVFRYDINLVKPCINLSVPGWKAPRPAKAGLKVDLAEKYHLPIYNIIDGLNDLKERMR